DLTRFYRGPLTATSANFQGMSPPRSVSELDPDLVAGVDLVIDGGWTPGGLPSTVLNLVSDPPVIIRRGALGEEVEEFLEKLERRGKGE
ncbi:MAG: Sua5/YciO/YrdC/YwlC family protein, partial [Proteobacteria bacterium]|nr:Sua5/YciO/YrdC/YwlC family protein [Pseudomonadota bacterium]